MTALRFDMHAINLGEGVQQRALTVDRELDRVIRAVGRSDLPLKDQAAAVEEAGRNLMMLDRPWRWWVLKGTLRRHADCGWVFWPLFLAWWDDGETKLTHGFASMLSRVVRNCGPAHNYMKPEDKSFFDALPEWVPVYRGTRRPSNNMNGISWTTDRDMAEWFARRYDGVDEGHGVLLSGRVRRSNIFAAFTERGESEVLCLPQHVRDRGERRVPFGCIPRPPGTGCATPITGPIPIE